MLEGKFGMKLAGGGGRGGVIRGELKEEYLFKISVVWRNRYISNIFKRVNYQIQLDNYLYFFKFYWYIFSIKWDSTIYSHGDPHPLPAPMSPSLYNSPLISLSGHWEFPPPSWKWWHQNITFFFKIYIHALRCMPTNVDSQWLKINVLLIFIDINWHEAHQHTKVRDTASARGITQEQCCGRNPFWHCIKSCHSFLHLVWNFSKPTEYYSKKYCNQT